MQRPPAASPVFVPIAAALGLGCSLPFLADRLAAPRLGTLPATLVFPLAKVTVEYLVSTVAPVGGIVGVLGVTQHGNLPLAQLASVTGVYGVSFLVAWFAPVALACWEHRRRWQTAVVTFAGVLAVVLAAGGIRLIAAAPGGETVRVAGVAPAPQAWQRTLDGIAPYESVEAMSQADPAVLQEAFGHVVDDLLARSAREAGAGAKLVVWPESAVVTMDRDEQALLTRFSEFARQHGIHLSAGLTVYTGSAPFVRNESVLFAPDGSVRWTYRKAHPTGTASRTGRPAPPGSARSRTASPWSGQRWRGCPRRSTRWAACWPRPTTSTAARTRRWWPMCRPTARARSTARSATSSPGCAWPRSPG